jgi:hypothetical protein
MRDTASYLIKEAWVWPVAKWIGSQALNIGAWTAGSALLDKLIGGGSAQQPQMPGQVGHPGMQGYGGHLDDSGYAPFSSLGMEGIRRTPRYQMGQMSMYGQSPFMHRGSDEHAEERQLAFEHGVDLFCKQAGFDEEDRKAMYELLKRADNDFESIPQRRSFLADWNPFGGEKFNRLVGQGVRGLYDATGAEPFRSYYGGFGKQDTAEYNDYLKRLGAGKAPLSMNEWRARNEAGETTAEANRERLASGGAVTTPSAVSKSSPAFQSMTAPSESGGGGGGQQNASSFWGQVEAGKVRPGGTVGEAKVMTPKEVQENLALAKAQESTFAQQGQDARAYRYQTALNEIRRGGRKNPLEDILQQSRGDLEMAQDLAKGLNVELPGGFRSTQTGGTRYDPSGGTSRTTRAGAPGTSRSSGSYQAPGVQGAGVPPAPEGASQFPGGWVAKSKDSGAGISQGDTARRDLQRRMGTNKFFGLQGQSTSAQNPSTLGMAEAAGLAGPSGGSSARFTGSIEDYERQNPQAGVVASAPTPPATRPPAAVPDATVGSGFSRPGSTPKSAPAPTKPATMQTYYNRPQIPEGLESATSTPMQGYV